MSIHDSSLLSFKNFRPRASNVWDYVLSRSFLLPLALILLCLFCLGVTEFSRLLGGFIL